MRTYIAFLRGINVSGKNMIKMPKLLALFENLGLKKIRTYIQSGNVIFQTSQRDLKTIENEIHDEIFHVFGYNVPVLIIDAEELKKIYENNPFLRRTEIDIDKLHVTLLNDSPSNENIAKLNAVRFDDEFLVSGKVIYLCCQNGYGRTKLNNTFFEQKIKLTATTRNWKSIGRILQLTDID
jgi:uncharacterized protein (DUF1697 family)